jgi:hypothetical protein
MKPSERYELALAAWRTRLNAKGQAAAAWHAAADKTKADTTAARTGLFKVADILATARANRDAQAADSEFWGTIDELYGVATRAKFEQTERGLVLIIEGDTFDVPRGFDFRASVTHEPQPDTPATVADKATMARAVADRFAAAIKDGRVEP